MDKGLMDKFNSIVIIMIFCLAIFLPFFIGLAEKDATDSKIEKRKLSARPNLPVKIKDIRTFPKSFETYYSDHYGLRIWFTKYYRLLKYKIGDSPSEHVTIGKNGWLFLGSIKHGYTERKDPMDDYRNVNLYSPEELERLSLHMKSVEGWLNDQDIKYIFVIAPNKHTIYYEQLPDYISKVNRYSATDQLVEYLRKQTDILIVDLRDKLLKEKNKNQLYFKTDTHWNYYGADIAQYEIMREIEKLFPGKIQPELHSFNNYEREGGDLANFIGSEMFKEWNPSPIFKNTCKPAKVPPDAHHRSTHTITCESQELKAIIFRDSFFNNLKPYFSRKFYRSTYIFSNFNYAIMKKHIELEKPDIVIEEWVERTLPFVPDS